VNRQPVIRSSGLGENWKWCYVDEGLIAWQSSYFEYKIRREIYCFKKCKLVINVKPILLLTTSWY
ncbi:MAG: hypothetical protein WCF01_05175, partial [Nitrososphaeraceae archaeon]